MNPFEEYAKRATSKRPDKLLGPVKTRHELRLTYADIVDRLGRCTTSQEVEAELSDMEAIITQIHAEHEFFWTGDGGFLGLEREIAQAQARVDDRLDFPRWD